jgi:hypothetical protein
VYHKRYAWIEGRDGKVLAVDGDIDTLERHMKDLAPEDAKLIGQFADAVRKMRDFPIPWQKAADLMGPMDKFRIVRGMFPFMGLFRKWGRLTVADVAKRLKDPFMREAFLHIFNLENPPEFPIMAVLKTFAWMDQGTLGYPVGGSLELARTIEGRYLDLGGEVHYRSRVEKILVEDDRAVGVRLADGSEHRADVVVSAADGRTTIFDMLDGRYADNKVKGYYENMRLFPPLIYVGLGIDRVMDDIPVTMTGMNFPFEEPVRIGDRDRDHVGAVLFVRPDPGARGQDPRPGPLPHRLRFLGRAQAGPRGLQGREGAGGGNGGRPAGHEVPRPRLQGGDARRGNADDLGPVHRQLAGQLRGLDRDNGHADHANEPEPSRPQGLLHGGPVGPAGGQRARGGHVGPQRGADHLPPGQEALRDVDAMRSTELLAI